MSDSKNTPRNHGRSKTKTSENLQIQFKKPSVANERLVVNKLGMKFDPVCWKKNHEKGKIQFVCIESNCNADRRLACAHCIIEEHDEHISNKVTVEQYCDTFENNFKSYLFQVAKLEEYYKKCKMMDLIDQIDKDINTVVEIVKQQLKALRDYYVQDIQLHAEQNNSSLFTFYNTERQTLSKIKDYAHKNLFEMTPAEMDHSMLLMGQSHLDKILIKLSEFDDQTSTLQSTMKSQWKLIYEQLEESLIDIIAQIGQNNLDFIQPIIKESQQEQYQSTNQQQNLDIQKFNLQNDKTSTKQQQINQQQQQQQQQQQLQQINQQQQQQINQQQQQQNNSLQAYITQQLPPQPQQYSQNSQSIKKEVSRHSGNTVQQQSSKQQTSNQPSSSNQQLSHKQLQSNSPRNSSDNQSFKQIQGICQYQVISPLKCGVNTASFGNLGSSNQKSLKNITQTNNNQVPIQSQTEQKNNSNAKPSSHIRQTSPNGVNYYYQSDGKQYENRKNVNHVQSLNSSSQQQQQQQSFERRLSAQKVQSTQFPCNYNNMKCIHNELIKASPIFSCCNWAFPCYECHDMISSHKAHITVPSQRFCQNCHEIFSVNLMSTVDVKCYKCQ